MQITPCQPGKDKENLQLIKFQSLINAVLPPQACLSCCQPVYRGLPLCEDCEAELPWQPPGCEQCGLFALDQDHVWHCANCRQSPPAFDRCHCVFAYTHPIPQMIRHFKDHGNFAPGRCLATLMSGAFRQYYFEQGSFPHWLVPVPLHYSRLRSRGFNQSVWMTRHIQACTPVPALMHACKRLATPRHQRGLGAQARILNTQNMFCAGPEADLTAGGHIAIIDDVVTTTATANAVSQILRQHGATRIDVWALARVN